MTSQYIANPFRKDGREKTGVVLMAHALVGTVRGKSINGLLIHHGALNVLAIVDRHAAGKKTSGLCPGVKHDVPIYASVDIALGAHQASALVILIDPAPCWYSEIETAVVKGLDLINCSFRFIRDNEHIRNLTKTFHTQYFDVRDLAHLQAYPNTAITNRKAKVVYVSGTDCGLGKRTATYELLLSAKRQNINAVMLATGQTGLMLGQAGTVIDASIVEFSNGIISQQICELDKEGYELIFVEGQSDIYHPAYSAVAIAILHGANPDAIILVHDENRKTHKGFDDTAALYKMHPFTRYIKAFEMLSLPCGPLYQTIGIATMGDTNIHQISSMLNGNEIVVADVLQQGGGEKLLDKIICHFGIVSKPVQNTITC
jgi:uncharacterized NAD-dependent epimerase/dehydratase family protein